jgi:hypothetical protein
VRRRRGIAAAAAGDEGDGMAWQWYDFGGAMATRAGKKLGEKLLTGGPHTERSRPTGGPERRPGPTWQ